MAKAESKGAGPAVADSGADPNRLIKVRATRLGYTNNPPGRRRPGDVFMVRSCDFSAKWMEQVATGTPLVSQTPSQAMRNAHLAATKPPRLNPVGMDVMDDDAAGDPTGAANVLD